jgi:hypothetical protein
MRKLLHKLSKVGFSLLVILAALAFASPAKAGTVTASSVDGCPDGGYVCFYNYESFNAAGGIYVQKDATASIPAGTCRVMPTSGISGWTNGKVYNATTSILLNWTGGNTVQRTITYYDSNACSASDYHFASVVYPGQLQTQLYRLADIGWNDRIGSFKVQ